MATQKNPGIVYTPFPNDLQTVEREKAHLLLEAHMMKAQQRFTEAADHFAQAARYEHTLSDWATAQGLTDLSYLHAFSALSCWAQAGDPHRAMEMGQKPLRSSTLTEPQRAQLQAYYDALEQRWVSWMQQWSPPAFTPA